MNRGNSIWMFLILTALLVIVFACGSNTKTIIEQVPADDDASVDDDTIVDDDSSSTDDDASSDDDDTSNDDDSANDDGRHGR